MFSVIHTFLCKICQRNKYLNITVHIDTNNAAGAYLPQANGHLITWESVCFRV